MAKANSAPDPQDALPRSVPSPNPLLTVLSERMDPRARARFDPNEASPWLCARPIRRGRGDVNGGEVADSVKDPVCGMQIRPEEAVATEDHDRRTFYFCSQDCYQAFVDDPHRYGHPEE
jgi:YHS domain-containing protein